MGVYGERPVTAIWNRDSIIELLAREFSRSVHEGRDLIVLLVTLDSARNPAIGPGQTDSVLGELAKRLAMLMNPYDHIGRYGAGQLLLLTMSSGMLDPASLAEEVKRAVEDNPLEIVGQAVRLAITVKATSLAHFPYRTHKEMLQALQDGSSAAQSEAGNHLPPMDAQMPFVSEAGFHFPIRPAIAIVFLAAIVTLLFLRPAWSCLPFRLYDLAETRELPPPLPANCALTADTPSDGTIASLDKVREDRQLELVQTITCKVGSDRRSQAAWLRQQPWLSSIYVNGVYQYRRHVFLSATENVPTGTLFTVQICRMSWWEYVRQPGEACWGEYAFWR